MAFQMGTNCHRRCLVEKDAHLWRVGGRFIKAAGCKLDNGLDLFAVETVKPLHNVVDVGPGFQILEDGGYRHARALKNPRAAYFAGDAFHRGTLRPIEVRHRGLQKRVSRSLRKTASIMAATKNKCYRFSVRAAMP